MSTQRCTLGAVAGGRCAGTPARPRPWLCSWGVFFCTRYAFKDLVVPATYQPSPRAKAADRVLSQIPDGATVESDLGLIAKLTNRTRVFYVGGAAPVVPQFFLIDDKAGWSPPLPDPVRYAESLHPGATYVFVTGGDGYRLLRRVP